MAISSLLTHLISNQLIYIPPDEAQTINVHSATRWVVSCNTNPTSNNKSIMSYKTTLLKPTIKRNLFLKCWKVDECMWEFSSNFQCDRGSFLKLVNSLNNILSSQSLGQVSQLTFLVQTAQGGDKSLLKSTLVHPSSSLVASSVNGINNVINYVNNLENPWIYLHFTYQVANLSRSSKLQAHYMSLLMSIV